MTPPPAWITRSETSSDVPAIHGVHLAAFETAEEAELVAALRGEPEWIPSLSVVATTGDGTIVGHALLTRCFVDEIPALALAPCAVLPDYQRSGAGSAAIRATLHMAQAQGESFVIVLGHPEYYPRFGFKRASPYGIRLSVEVPDDALMALSLNTDRRLPAGVVRYSAPFGI